MTDKELLEAAARASGIVCSWAHEDESDFSASTEGMWLNGERSPDNSKFWNPLKDDGDALRLAVKLGLTICNEHESAGSVCCTRADGEEFPLVLSGEVGDPPGITNADYAATRRAIVLAAAEIGKKSPEATQRKSA